MESLLNVFSNLLDSVIAHPFHGKVVRDGNHITITIANVENCYKPAEKNLTEEEKKAAEEEAKKEKECVELKEAFEKYIDGIDDDIFIDVVESFKDGSLAVYNNTINNSNDPEKVSAAINLVKKACNEAIMRKVISLKSQMC